MSRHESFSMHNRLAILSLLALAMLFISGCDNMSDGARVKPLEPTGFFEDGASSRPLVEGTVARGQLGRQSDPFYTGRDAEGMGLARAPIDLDIISLTRGQERFNIHCSPCHGQIGFGDGMIFQRGFPKPANLTEARLMAVPDGHLFDVITNGFGKMLPFGSRIEAGDRWAIVLYVRALQLSQHTDVAMLDAQDAKALREAGASGGEAGEAKNKPATSQHSDTVMPEGH